MVEVDGQYALTGEPMESAATRTTTTVTALLNILNLSVLAGGCEFDSPVEQLA
ncbi:MAG: hypothetical protein OXT74_03010 [Candidatus Poribacteria bacterium]|nr:hypothetical protein [Candidatus Poribacteria bacterium]